jgi:hypothetical protein
MGLPQVETTTIDVPVDDLRRVLYAVDIAATWDPMMLSGSQERAVMSLRRIMREAGHALT